MLPAPPASAPTNLSPIASITSARNTPPATANPRSTAPSSAGSATTVIVSSNVARLPLLVAVTVTEVVPSARGVEVSTASPRLAVATLGSGSEAT